MDKSDLFREAIKTFVRVQAAKRLAALGRRAPKMPVYFQHLPQMQQANWREVLVLIEKERLFGWGYGLVNLTLLASTLMTPGAELWTLDRRLGDLAQRFAAAHRPVER
uniref:Uncharacterized protein n=1 Tax=Variovorax paradoxus (strain S110) TaxID=543728 RepID=C5D048_VARPS